MKKKHRRAVCFAILVIPMFLSIIFGVIADLTRWIAESIIDAADWLKIKLRVYDEDPDYKDCKHWCDGMCGLTPAFMPTDKGLALNVWCRGVDCPDYQPKEKKDEKAKDE